jgi:hypothetical protein
VAFEIRRLIAYLLEFYVEENDDFIYYRLSSYLMFRMIFDFFFGTKIRIIRKYILDQIKSIASAEEECSQTSNKKKK